MPKRMTPSEEMVGRKLPDLPKHIDTLMAGFVKDRATEDFCGRIKSIDRWMQPAHLKARRSGWLRSSGVSFGKGMEIWVLTDAGKEVALKSFDLVASIQAQRDQWSRDWNEAYRLQRQGAAAALPDDGIKP